MTIRGPELATLQTEQPVLEQGAYRAGVTAQKATNQTMNYTREQTKNKAKMREVRKKA